MNTYGLGVVPIPTNRRCSASTIADLIYKTEEAKFNAIIDDIEPRHEKGQPILVGTASVGSPSEILGRLLTQRGIPTRCSTPSSTPVKPRSSPRPVARSGHRRHQHGRPWRRHPARRQPRGACRTTSRSSIAS
jgi:hypothetical protein